MTERLLPPRFSFSSQVRTESRYGMKASFTDDSLAKLLMTRPRVLSDLLIMPPSRSLSPSETLG